MRFMTVSECLGWIRALNLEVLASIDTVPAGIHSLSCDTPLQEIPWFSRFIVDSLGPFGSCLLWPGDPGVWPTSESLHLYYKFRQSYGELRLSHEGTVTFRSSDLPKLEEMRQHLVRIGARGVELVEAS